MIERIKNIFKKLVPHSDREDRDRVNRDWMIILTVFVVIVLLVTIFNIRLFIRIDKGELFVIEDSDEMTVTSTLDEALLGDTLEFFKEKGNRFEQLKRSVPPIPSVR